jgi:hypothetical protein
VPVRVKVAFAGRVTRAGDGGGAAQAAPKWATALRISPESTRSPWVSAVIRL